MSVVLREAVLLFGIGSQALPAWDQENEQGNLNNGLRVLPHSTKSRHALASSFVPRRTTSHLRGETLIAPYPRKSHSSDQAHAVASSLVQRNSVPSLQIRCMMTAIRRAKATMALRRPPRLARLIAQALSQDHFFTRVSMT